MASACCTPAAIARFVHHQHDDLLAALPPTVTCLPSEATLRRTLAALDVEVLERELRDFLAPPAAPVPPDPSAPVQLHGLALDGKAIRAVGRDGHPCIRRSRACPRLHRRASLLAHLLTS